MWAGVVCAVHCRVATWLEGNDAKQEEEQSGRGVRKHMCCATPSLKGAFARKHLSIHVKTKVTVLSDICTYMGSVCSWVCVPESGFVCVYV